MISHFEESTLQRGVGATKVAGRKLILGRQPFITFLPQPEVAGLEDPWVLHGFTMFTLW